MQLEELPRYCRQASLREDYLSQVQRDFLSRSFDTATPLADAITNFFATTNLILRQTQQFVQMGGSGRVLKRGLTLWVEPRGCAKGGQGGFVKAAQNQFLFTGVGIDVAHGVDARGLGCKAFCINAQLLALHGQAPMRYGAEFG